jgi:hypothetical protein
MKKILAAMLFVMIAFGFGLGSAWAANSLKAGSGGLSAGVDEDFVISGRYFLQDDLAVLADLGIGIKGGDAEGIDLGIGGGVRKYLTTEDFAPFVGGSLFYRTTQDGDQTELSLLGNFGAEFFLHKQVSIEGSVGFGYFSEKTTVGPVSFKETTIGTRSFGVGLNFYFF